MTVPDLARAIASARGVCGTVILASALGCGGDSFSAGPGDDGGAGGDGAGGQADGGSPGDDGGSASDGGGTVIDAGPSYCALSGAQFELCSDFDTGALIPPWDREVTAGSTTSSRIDSAAAKSAPASLLTTVTPSSAPAPGSVLQDIVLKSGVKKQNAQLQLDLDIERVSFGGSDALSSVAVATIAQGTDYTVSLVLRPPSSGSGATAYQLAILETSGSNAPNVRPLKVLPALGAWAHVTMDINLNALQASVNVQVDANAAEKVALSPSPGALATTAVRSLGVGVTITGPVADYSARIDNVTYK